MNIIRKKRIRSSFCLSLPVKTIEENVWVYHRGKSSFNPTRKTRTFLNNVQDQMEHEITIYFPALRTKVISTLTEYRFPTFFSEFLFQIQATLVIRSFAIPGFDYSRTRKQGKTQFQLKLDLILRFWYSWTSNSLGT